MPNYYSPGVYIEEVNKGPRPIEAVATSVAAFVGFAPAGPVRRPELVTSWSQFVERFGLRDIETGRKSPYMDRAYLAHAVYGYFLNGGARCYVVRVVPPDAMNAKANTLKILERRPRDGDDKPAEVLHVAAKENPLKDDIEVSVERARGTTPAERRVNIIVRQGEISEEYRDIELKEARTPAPRRPRAEGEAAPPQPDPAPAPDPTARSKGPGNLTELNEKSKLVQITLAPNASTLLPMPGAYYLEVVQPEPKVLMQVSDQDMIGDASERSGILGTELAEDVTMVCCPDLMSTLIYDRADATAQERIKAVQTSMINHCELVGGRVALLDAPPDYLPQEIERWRLKEVNYDSMFAALYYPWIAVANPRADESGESPTIFVPPCGHIAGIYARNDTERGVHKAPANEIVRGALKLARDVTKGEQDGLNPSGINCIRTFSGRGIRVWGARTLSSDPAWRYVNVRRLFNMVEKSIERDTQWVVFEPNGPDLWSRVRRDVGAFLTTLWRDGMLFGETQQEAFYVKCDAELNPPESRDLGRLIIEVGLAPVKPAEFVVYRFSQYASGA
jgi:uncharacterized protein